MWNYCLLMHQNSIQKNIVMATSNNISETLDHPINMKSAQCLIVVSLACVVDPIYCSVSFMPQAFLLGYYG